MRKKRKLTEEHKRKIGLASLGKKKIFSDEAKENIRKAASKRKGISTGSRSEEVKEKIRQATIGKKKIIKEKNPTWFAKGHSPEKPFAKGHKPWNTGKKLKPESIEKMRLKKIAQGKHRRCFRANEWARNVKERDGHKCQKCEAIEKLHAHHIVPWKDDESKRFDLQNGITYCNSCHATVELTGKKRPKEVMDKLTPFKKGHIPWNKKI